MTKRKMDAVREAEEGVCMVEGQRRGTSQEEEHIGGIGIGAPAEGEIERR
jgi:hypothetical protein